MEWGDLFSNATHNHRIIWDERNPQAGWACTSGWCFPRSHHLKSVTKLHHKVPGPSKLRHKYLNHFDFKTLKGEKCKTSENLPPSAQDKHMQHLDLRDGIWIQVKLAAPQSPSQAPPSFYYLDFVNKWWQPELVAEFPTLPACSHDVSKAGALSSLKSLTSGRVKSIVPGTKLPLHQHSQVISLQELCFQHSTA